MEIIFTTPDEYKDNENYKLSCQWGYNLSTMGPDFQNLLFNTINDPVVLAGLKEGKDTYELQHSREDQNLPSWWREDLAAEFNEVSHPPLPLEDYEER